MATSASLFPGITMADKLRLAASKGQLDKVKELVVNGASFEPDKVKHYIAAIMTLMILYYELISVPIEPGLSKIVY